MSNCKVKRVIIVPGNGCVPIENANWYTWLQETLQKEFSEVEIICKEMTDPILAREYIWLPFIRSLGSGEHTIVVGHSSGAEAAMRLAESDKLYGIILISPCYTDLGEESESISGYYNREWKWIDIKQNCRWIVQFSSETDPFIPIKEALHVRDQLETEYIQLKKRGHFMTSTFPELFQVIKEKILASRF